MKEHLITYFITKGRVDLPHIGTLYLEIQSATITNSAIEPPKYQVSFTTDSNGVSLSQLQYLSNELDKSIDQIKLELKDLVTEIKNQGLFVFGNFGVIKYINDVFIFESFFTDADYQLPIEISIETSVSETLTNSLHNNNWIWWALGLTAIALLAIYFK